jgi:hypothetical protein
MNDFEFQAEYVAQQAWRLLAMQDRNELSPSHGCFHYAYWRDKTSEFPDARFQEAGAALGLLSLPAFDDLRAQVMAPPPEQLYASFAAAARNWSRQQYGDGALDEWYKGERGFAAVEFTMIAYGLALHFMGELVRPADRDVIITTIKKAGDWLLPRHDRVKANHEMAAAAALALAWKATGELPYKSAAREKVADTLVRQTEEGWFPEIGGMDHGYCSVLLDYAMLYYLITSDDDVLPPMRRLFAFMLPHLHPNLTISCEAGTCLNPYVSRLGIGLLSAHDPAAAAAVAVFQQFTPGLEGVAPYLMDDLRLARWSYLPLATHLLSGRFRADPGGADAFAARYPQGWLMRKQAAIASFHRGNIHIAFSPVGGGMVRIYRDRTLILEDGGLTIEHGGERWGMAGYDPERRIVINGDNCSFRGKLFPAQFFFPGLLPRLILRIGCMVPQGAYLLRALIDRQRLRKKTAVNQSAAPVAKPHEGYEFERSVTVDLDGVDIIDRLHSFPGAPGATTVKALLRHRGQAVAPAELPERFARLTLRKRIAFSGGDALQIHVEQV